LIAEGVSPERVTLAKDDAEGLLFVVQHDSLSKDQESFREDVQPQATTTH